MAGERDGDHRALAHAARQLVRVVARPARRVGNLHGVEQLDRARLRLGPRAAVHGERLGNLIADAHHRVERRHRLLEDERDARAPHLAHLGLAQGQQVAPLEEHRAAGDAARRLQQPQDRERGHRLAAARFADDAQRLPRRHLQAHVVHGGAPAAERDGEMLDVEQTGRQRIRWYRGARRRRRAAYRQSRPEWRGARRRR